MTDSETEAVLNQAKFYESRFAILDKKLESDVFDGQIMRFKANHSFLGDQDPLRKLLSSTVDKKSNYLQNEQVFFDTLNSNQSIECQTIYE